MSELESWAMRGEMEYAYDGGDSGRIPCEMILRDGVLTLEEDGYIWKGRMTEPSQYELTLQDGKGSGYLNVEAPDVFSGRFVGEGYTGEWSIMLDADLEW